MIVSSEPLSSHTHLLAYQRDHHHSCVRTGSSFDMLSTARTNATPIRGAVINEIHNIQKIRTKSVISIKIRPKCVFPTAVLAAEVRKHNLRPNEFLIIRCKFCLLVRRDLAGFSWNLSKYTKAEKCQDLHISIYHCLFSDLKS